jgi:hypothetical protein
MKGILLGDDDDLLVSNGSLVIGEITQQNQRSLLLAQKGEIKEYPLVGVGINNFLDDEDTTSLLTVAREQFTKDGMNVKKMGFNSKGQLIVDAEYKK